MRCEKVRADDATTHKLGLEPNSASSLAMLPSYVCSLPDGSTTGVAYALDIGGSNLRVLKVLLEGNGGTSGIFNRERSIETSSLLGFFFAQCLHCRSSKNLQSSPIASPFCNIPHRQQ